MLKNSGFAVLVIALLSVLSSAQQDKSKRPSPPAQAQCKFSDGKTISVDYSSPRAKGRKIFGELVPYGQVWRTGANDATTLVTTTTLSGLKARRYLCAGKLHDLHRPRAEQVDAHRQQAYWRMGYPLQV